jgi:hypothetical protein
MLKIDICVAFTKWKQLGIINVSSLPVKLLITSAFSTSPYPLQRGTERTYPPLEGAGGGLIAHCLSSSHCLKINF